MIKKTLCAILAFCMLFTMVGVTCAVAGESNTDPDVEITVNVADELITFEKGKFVAENVLKIDFSVEGIDSETETIKSLGKIKLNFDSEKTKVLTRTQSGKESAVKEINTTTWNESAMRYDSDSLELDFNATNYVVPELDFETDTYLPVKLATVYLQVKENVDVTNLVLNLTIDDSELKVTNGGNTEYSYGFNAKSFTFDKREEMTGVDVTGDIFDYDGELHNVTVTGAPEGSSISYICDGEEFTGAKAVGTYEVTALVEHNNYKPFTKSARIDIVPLEITASVEGTDREYDATTNFEATATLEGVIDGDEVTVECTEGALDSKNIGTRTGSVEVSIAGADAANYVLSEDTFNDIEVEISPKEITASVEGTDREYDATTTFEATATLDGVIDGDVVNSYCEEDELDSKNVGTRVGSVVVLITGEDAANYTLATSTFDNVTVEISPKEITASVTGTDKTYDATTAFVATATLEGVIDGDVVETSAVGTLTSKNAGSYTDGNAVVTLEGTDAANYVLAEDTFNDVAVTVTAKDVTATVTATNREYDATTAFVATATLEGVIDGDVVETTATGSLTSKNAGEHTDATVAVTINGADAANYNLTNPTVADVAVTISAKALTVTGVTAKNRKADGTTVVEIDSTNKVVTGVINEDIVTVNVPATGSIESAAAGSNKVVTITGITLEGADAANYTVTDPTDVTVNISSAGSGNYRPSYSGGGSSSSTVTPPADDKKDEEVKDEEVKDDEVKDEEVKDLTKATADVSLKEKASEIKFVETDEEGNFYPDAEATRDDVVNALNEVLDIENATGDCELKDIENAENAEIVELFTKANIIAGYEDGTFRGTDSITRAEFVKVLAVALGVEIKDFEEDKFDDLAGHWSVDYVNSFVELGYIIGYPDGTFRPDARISKAEMVIVINRAIGKDVDASDNIDVEIADIDDAHWAYKYIKAAVK
ncbi:MAG: S-layer homology domain-containing protein [Clostridia bacterium]|nr:S-layer homology domain-containing protein [Clostridia bacterium]